MGGRCRPDDATGGASRAAPTVGVILRGMGDVLAFCPPLVITDEQVVAMLDHLADVLVERR